MSVSSELIEAEEGSRERLVYRQYVRSTDNNLDLFLIGMWSGGCLQRLSS